MEIMDSCTCTSRQPRPPKELTPLPKVAYVITIAVTCLLLESASVHPAALADMIWKGYVWEGYRMYL
jgi:hypothetical protein